MSVKIKRPIHPAGRSLGNLAGIVASVVLVSFIQ